MNVRKPVDYGTMYRELTAILTQNLSQMDEVYAIGKAISQRPEKGAAVAAAEFLQANFPDRAGFSPRNVRRMRDFYKTYENDQTLLRLAMKIGWTLNVVIMEAELTSEARKWYLKQARERQWSKKELLDILSSGFEPDTEADHENSSLRFSESCGIINQKMKEQPLSHLAENTTAIRTRLGWTQWCFSYFLCVFSTFTPCLAQSILDVKLENA